MKNKIIYVVEDLNSVQVRYRVENIIEALRGSEKWEGELALKRDIDKIDFTDVKILSICRQTDKDGRVLKLISMAHKNNVKVLFDLDDIVFSYGALPTLMRGVDNRNVPYWMGYVWGIRRIAKRVDGFVTTNDFLAKKLEMSFGKIVKVIPNSLNSEQIKVADESLGEKKHDGFVIGYFSGSPTHVKDLRLVEPEIFKLLDEHKDARLRVVGFMEPSSEMKKRIESGQVEILKFVDYLEQIRMMSKIDVNIAPLVISEFTNCKSELKFFEAAAVETTTIASPTYTFKKAISNGENGFLAKSGEWYDKLEYLYNNPVENQKIAKKAMEYALKHYYGKEFLREVEEAYNAFI